MLPATAPKFPSEAEIALAKQSCRDLSKILLSGRDTYEFTVRGANGIVDTVRMPSFVLRMLVEILTEMSQGNAVSILVDSIDADRRKAFKGLPAQAQEEHRDRL